MSIYDQYETTIGLEIHVQLNTKSKAFCGDANNFGAAPNTQVSPVTIAHPGTLPRLNKKQVAAAAKLGLALNCEVHQVSYFDRKNYFYADLPKGYQISQDHQAICTDGYIDIRLKNGETKRIRIHQIHMEEDAGKSIHDQDPNYSLVDLNRAGVPLLEIVSEPDLSSPEEAHVFIAAIRQLVRYLEISDGNMEEGSLRCDCNVSVRKKGTTELGTRREVKNVNSMRNVKRAIEFERKSQIDLLESGKTVDQETRSFDAQKGTTSSLRSKEDAHDYRYFLDPDLPPVMLSTDYFAQLRAEMPALPQELFQQFTQEFKLSDYDANVLIEDKHLALYFLDLVAQKISPKSAANWMSNVIKSHLNQSQLAIQDFMVSPSQLAALIQLVESDQVNQLVAKQQLFPALVAAPNRKPLELAKKLDILQAASNEEDLEALVLEILQQHPDKIAKYKKGKKGLLGFFVGQVMRQTKGKVNPKEVNPMVAKLLDSI
ncbi:MAG: Asp-tRNA(Asn)/Glu-tRNA(Gln) amidotransferase subunit GatB [Aureispira sp.]|nr:Asp-tRNA(Asn)/Glu-tRNA(Gln) amidotransferase subunit GatB [Aureispira sp.]